jgi:hypothetical protein
LCVIAGEADFGVECFAGVNSLRFLCVLCVSAFYRCPSVYRRDAENAEETQSFLGMLPCDNMRAT